MNVRLKMDKDDELEIHQEEIWIAPQFDIMEALDKLIRAEEDSRRLREFKQAMELE